MKYFLLLFLVTFTFGQWHQVPDTLKKLCIERGHVESGHVKVTEMMESTRIVDLPDRTLKIYSDPNIYTYKCLRCGMSISEHEMNSDTIVVWRRRGMHLGTGWFFPPDRFALDDSVYMRQLWDRQEDD